MPPRKENKGDPHKVLSGPGSELLSRMFQALVEGYLKKPDEVLNGYMEGFLKMKKMDPVVALSTLKYNITTLESLIAVEKASPTDGSEETEKKLIAFLERLQAELASW